MSKLQLVALACFLVASAALNYQQVDISATPWSVSTVSVVYDIRDDITTFTYEVDAGSGDNYLSHFVIAATTCGNALIADDVQSDFQDFTTTADPATGLKGFLYPIGQDGTDHVYTLKFHGRVGYSATAQYAVKGHHRFAISGPVYGPDCNVNAFVGLVPAGVPMDAEVPCTTNTSKPAGAVFQIVDTTNSHCPAEKLVKNYYRAQSGSDPVFGETYSVLTVKDTTPPTFIEPLGFKSYIELTCNDPIPPIPGVTAQDDCDPDPILQPPCSEQRANGTCPTNYFLRRTWTATDHCGNSKCKTQTIAIIDKKAPILIGVPNNTVIECEGTLPIPAAPTVTAQDDCNCFKNPEEPVSLKEETRPGECNNTYDTIRIWTSTDCCGNTVSATQIVMVQDTTPPGIWFTTTPSSGTFECDDVPDAPSADSWDTCMNSKPQIYVNQTITNSTQCPKQDYTITRVYYTIDDCGNYNSTTSVFVVVDNTPPKWDVSSLPANETVQCGDVTEPADPTATDNCGSHDVVRHPDERHNTSCPNEYIIIRRWSVTDNCGNYNNYTQYVNVVDTIPTYIDTTTLPTLGPFQCAVDMHSIDNADDINGIKPLGCNAGQNCKCDTSFVKTWTETRINGTCANRFNLTRYYTFTDCSGNNDTKSKNYYVADTTAPAINGVPGNTTNECTAVDAIAVVTTTDNCDGDKPPVYSNYNISGDCAGDYTVVRTWNISDDCGNTNSKSQFITVRDTKAPVFDYEPPANSSICAAPPKPILTASDACSGVTVYNNLPSITTNKKCNSNYTITHFWAAVDGCGHWKNISQVVTVYDNVLPTLSGVQPDKNVTCEDIPLPDPVCATDNCVGVNITFTETRNNYPCTADGFYYTLVRTWTAKDDCGNTVSQTQNINVYNRHTPQFFPPTQNNLFQTCDNVQLPPAPTANDSCSNAPVVPYHFRVNTSCPDSYVLHRNFKASDIPCGNSNWLNYTITVTDTEAPTFTFVPPNNVTKCVLPDYLAPKATDKCDATPTILGPLDTIISFTCPHIYTVNRTWNVSDDCGNINFASQIISVTNDVIPSWGVVMPANVSGMQSCTPPPVPVVNATAGCGETVTVTFTQWRVNSSCEYNYTLYRQWVAEDECFHTISYTQSIVLFDKEVPTVSSVAPYVENYCVAPAIPDVCVSDNCAGVKLFFDETQTAFKCTHNRTLSRVWVGVDDCGNKASVSQEVVIFDAVAPVFDSVPPSNYDVNCSLPTIPKPKANDTCAGPVQVIDHSYRTNGTCENDWFYHVSFSATDDCGNTAWYNYTIHVIENTTPTVTWDVVPQDGSFTCENPPAAPIPTVTGLCQDGFYVFNEVRVNGTCSDKFNLTRTWTIKDACGNHNFDVTQFLYGIHPNNPTIDAVSNDTAKCKFPAALPEPKAHDDCGHTFDTVFSNSTQDFSCPDTFLERREWTFTDECGLSASRVQWVQHTDLDAPTLTIPAQKNETNKCNPIYPAASDATVSDDCDNAPLLNVSTFIHDRQCDYVYALTNNFTTEDRCHNVNWKAVTNYYTWTTEPTIVPPADFNSHPTYQCNDVKVAPEVTAHDGCGKSLNVSFLEVRINGSCPNQYTLVRTWNVTDNCGIPSSLEQIVSVIDTFEPTFCNLPQDTMVQCGLVPPVEDVSVTDTCPGITITFNETKVNITNCCNYKLLRTWTAIDACGNDKSYTQTITVFDHEPLEFFGIPPDVLCDSPGNCPFEFKPANVTAKKPPLARGFCVNGDVSRDVVAPGPNPPRVDLQIGGVTKTFEVTGGELITFIDKTAEVELVLVDISNNAVYNLTVALSMGKTLAELSGYTAGNVISTNYPAVANVSYWIFYQGLSGVLTGGPSGSPVSIPLSLDTTPLYSQVGVGASGLNQNYGALVSFQYSDNGAVKHASVPVDVRKNGVDGCTFAPGSLPVYEACNCSYPVNLTLIRHNGSCEQTYRLEAKYCAADENGAVYCLSQDNFVCDKLAPNISQNFNNDTTSYCTSPNPPEFDLTASDTCDNFPRINHTDTRYNDSNCPSKYTIIRNVYAVDDCGNRNDIVITYKWDDKVNPIVTISPHNDNDEFECDGIPAPPTATATDVCGINDTFPVTTNMNMSRPNPGTGKTCEFSYTQTFTYFAEDLCGNDDSKTYSRIVKDTKAPGIFNVKPDESLYCKVPYTVASPTANDTCSGDLTPEISVTNSTSPSACPNIFDRTYYFDVQDDCGNAAPQKTWTVSYYDDVPPNWVEALPENVTEKCNNVSQAAVLTATDDCNFAWVNFTQYTINGSCPNEYLIIRTWVAHDCAGNSRFHVQQVTVIDDSNPVISPRPSDSIAACTPAPTRPSFCVTDNCDGVSMTFTEERIQTDPNHLSWTCDRYYLNRTVVAVDACGHVDVVNYHVYVNDTTAPTCTPNTFSANISCEHDHVGDGFTPVPPTCHDDCQNDTHTAPNVTLFQWSEAGPQQCNNSRIHHYDYYVTDNCGNDVWHNSTINVFDRTVPTLSNVPASADLKCLATFPADTTVANDNCDTAVYINKTVVRVNSSCPNIYNVSITWFPVDECGNVGAVDNSLFVYFDDVPPFWTSPLPQNDTVVCDKVPDTPFMSASDDCSGNAYTHVDYKNWTVQDDLHCSNSYFLYREWVASDCSGNTIRHVQLLHVIDNVTATISDLPADQEYFCKSVPAPVSVCASDNCPGVKLDYIATKTSNASSPTCHDQYVINRTYSATDDCGNVVTKNYLLVVDDVVPPNCTTNDDRNTTCQAPLAADPTQPTCGEDCSSPHYSTFHSVDLNGPQNCNASYYRKFSWKIEDDCGNFIWRNSTVLVYDNEPPTLSNPPSDNPTAECSDVPPTPQVFSGDNCNAQEVKIDYSNTSSQVLGACQDYDIIRTWVVTDGCGNHRTYQQVVNVSDTGKPFWTGTFPPNNGNNYTYECSDSFQAPVLTAADLCGDVNVEFFATNVSFPEQACENSYATNWTWVATDKCGHSISYTTFVFVNDTIKPTLSTPPAGGSHECTDVPAPPAMCCGDNCNGVDMFYTQTRINGSCPYQYQLVRNWTCVDACGNQDTKIQTVDVTDHTFPQWIAPTPLPGYEFFECDLQDSQVTLQANDSCSTVNVTQYYLNQSRGCDHNYTIYRYWTGVDECGNEITWNQTVDVRDTQPPWTNTSTLLCYFPEQSSPTGVTDDKLIINDFTKVNNFFKGYDACSTVRIVFDVTVDCKSDQDDLFGSGCVYNASSDTLTISLNRSSTRPEGRLYTISALVYDQCDHSVSTSRQIFVPLNENSGSKRNFTGEDAISVATCVTAPNLCPDNCACQTVDTACLQDGSVSTTLSATSTYSSLTDTTVFTYTASGTNKNRVVLAVDFSKYNLVSWSPDSGVVIGPQSGTYFNGISFQPTAPNCDLGDQDCPTISLPTVSITIRGHYFGSTAKQIPYQIGGGGLSQDSNVFSTNNSACTDGSGFQAIFGPADASSVNYTGANDLQGYVRLAGWRDGDDRSLNFGVADVVVALYEAFSPANVAYVDNIVTSTLPVPIAYALTDATGKYVFPKLTKTADKYLVKIQRDGLLKATARSSGRFLTHPVYSHSTYPAYYPTDPSKFVGFAQSASSPDFSLIFDDENKPEYLRFYTSQVFEGNAKIPQYWSYIMTYRSTYPQNAVLLAGYQSYVADRLATCAAGYATGDATSFPAPAGNEFEIQLKALAYNLASGRGPFEPYRLVAEWTLEWAHHIFCTSSSSSNDNALALNWLKLMNTADDDDRPSPKPITLIPL